MKDALLRTLTSAAAGLFVYVLSGLISGLDQWGKAGISGAAFIVVLIGSILIGRASPDKGSPTTGPRYFSGLRGKNVTIKGVRGPALLESGEFLSDVHAKQSINIDDVGSSSNPQQP
ncbi:hypothetical protein ET989_00005 [Propioniciclava sinopodophylli]|uniref:Uncharacterized protein n=1 Tax=Propioniciclava sinopodophylli TaxID=1837344 RepID=A0A4V2JSR5_9ACTN|nr:hypothetical protein [Propioniciclava sinopodophylli]TBT88388.1 hypothetical protein ET989_00005 [Propioniciclava sinopodophylli]